MAASKINRFLGIAPKSASELLPDTAAQIAHNCKLVSGDIVAYPTPVVASSSGHTGTTQTLHALRDPDTNEPVFLTWANNVDVVAPATNELNDQRFYYTGDGYPKVSTYALATNGLAPYPVFGGFYRLGLPLPTIVPTTVATPFSTVATSTISRDSSGNVTLVTATAHNLKNNTYVAISGFTSIAGTYVRAGKIITVTIASHGLTSGDNVVLRITSGNATTNQYNITVTSSDTFTVTDSVSGATSGDLELDLGSFNTNTEVTVVNATTITYLTSGFALATRSFTSGKVELGASLQARSYLYTWYNPWLEESIGSVPASPLFIKEGQIVTVSDLPTTPPSGNYFIRAIRVYRTLAGNSDASYFLLKTLWFPSTIVSARRSDNVVYVTTEYQHALAEGDRFKIDGSSTAAFDVADGEVSVVVDEYTFGFEQSGLDIAETLLTSGTVYYDVAESVAYTARYWGYGGDYDFTDDFNYRSLTDTLESNTYDEPPEALSGITIYKNNVLVGFSGNDIYFSEPGKFHAWPYDYMRSVDGNVVGLATFGGTLLVLTDGYPYVIEGNDPATLTVTRLSSLYPCVSARSIVVTSTGIIYATHDGLAIYSSGIGAQLITKAIFDRDTWAEHLVPATITGVSLRDSYFASHSTGSLVYDYAGVNASGQQTPTFVTLSVMFTAHWYDTISDSMYIVTNTDGTIHKWDDTTQPPLDMQWKSKTIVMQQFDNLGAARVVADYATVGTASNWEDIDEYWEVTSLNWDIDDPITFKLYADKQVVFTTTRSNSDVFKLPAGYKTDTYEVEVSGTVRIRAIHIGNTATELRQV